MYPPLSLSDFDLEIEVAKHTAVPNLSGKNDTDIVIKPIRTDHDVVYFTENGYKYNTRNVICSASNSAETFVLPVQWFLSATRGQLNGVTARRAVIAVQNSNVVRRDRSDNKSKKVQNAIAVRNKPVKQTDSSKVSKKDRAFALLAENPNIARQAAIRLLVENVELTPAGASTYFQLYRSK